MSFGNFNSSDWSNFTYLSLLLIYLASGLIFKSNLKTSVLFKQFMAWVGIALIALIIYSFRFQFYDIKNRLSAELFPSKVTKISNNQISIGLADDGHFHMNLEINGILVQFLVDTGATDIALTMQDAKRLGFDVNNLSFTKIYYSANGRVYGAPINLEKVEIGDIIFSDVSATVNQGDLNNSLLGMSFLKKFKKYEFYQDRLILTY